MAPKRLPVSDREIAIIEVLTHARISRAIDNCCMYVCEANELSDIDRAVECSRCPDLSLLDRCSRLTRYSLTIQPSNTLLCYRVHEHRHRVIGWLYLYPANYHPSIHRSSHHDVSLRAPLLPLLLVLVVVILLIVVIVVIIAIVIIVLLAIFASTLIH